MREYGHYAVGTYFCIYWGSAATLYVTFSIRPIPKKFVNPDPIVAKMANWAEEWGPVTSAD